MDYPQDLVNRAYQLARPHGAGSVLSRIELIELITRAGIPEDLARRAADDTLLDRKAEALKKATHLLRYGLVLLFIGTCVLAAGFVFRLPFIIIPAVFFLGMIFTAAGLWRWNKLR